MTGKSSSSSSSSSSSIKPSRITFGSCSSQGLSQPLWPVIISRNSSAFVWGGDSIYADHIHKSGYMNLKHERVCATPTILETDYKQQLSHPDYQALINTPNFTVFGTIDDHDMGCNNADKSYPYTLSSGIEFLKFVNEPMDSPMTKRASQGLGVYGVKLFDFDRPNGMELVPEEEACIDPDVVIMNEEEKTATPSYSKKSVAVFVLDVRTNKTPWGTGWNRMKPDPTGDFLGEEQWKWFQNALSRSKASVNVIVQGLQVHPERIPDAALAETWDKFPMAQQRLYDTILKERIEAPFIISGDVHMAQLMRKDCYPNESSKSSSSSSPPFAYRPLMELTTSGMTHSWGTFFSPRKWLHESWYAPYAYFISRSLMSFMHVIIPMPDLLTSDGNSFLKDGEETPTIWDRLKLTSLGAVKQAKHSKLYPNVFENGGAEGAKEGKQFALDLNFAELEFDWEEEILMARIFGKEAKAPPLMSASWSFDQLSGRAALPQNAINVDRDVLPQMSPSSPSQWICIPVGGIANPYQVFLSRALGICFAFVLLFGPFICFIYLVFAFTKAVFQRLLKLRIRLLGYDTVIT